MRRKNRLFGRRHDLVVPIDFSFRDETVAPYRRLSQSHIGTVKVVISTVSVHSEWYMAFYKTALGTSQNIVGIKTLFDFLSN